MSTDFKDGIITGLRMGQAGLKVEIDSFADGDSQEGWPVMNLNNVWELLETQIRSFINV